LCTVEKEEMEDDFQFVDLETIDSSKDVKNAKEDVQKLTELWSLHHGELKSLQKEVSECQMSISTMFEELKQMKEEKKENARTDEIIRNQK